MFTRPVLKEVIFDEMYTDPLKGNVRLEYLPDIFAMHLQWYDVLSHEDHTKFANRTIAYIKRKKAKGWIRNVSRVIEPMAGDIAFYIADTWFPAAVNAFITRLAIIMPMVPRVLLSTKKIAEVLALKAWRAYQELSNPEF